MYVKWNLTKKCTLGCKFCINAQSRKKWNTDTNEDELKKIIENISSVEDLRGITLLGGDPLEYEHIHVLTKELEKSNIPFGFITAGELLYTGQYDQILMNSKLDFIGLSIDSLNQEIVKSVRGRDILDKQIKSLDYLIDLRRNEDLKYKIFTNTILMNINEGTVVELIDYFINKNVDKVQILEYNSSGNEKHNFSISFTDELEFLEKLIVYVEQSHVQVQNNDNRLSKLELCFLPELGKKYFSERVGIPGLRQGSSNVCPVFRGTIFLSNDGLVYPCDSYKPYIRFNEVTGVPDKVYPIENILEHNLSSIVHGNAFFQEFNAIVNKSKNELYSNFEPCQTCDYLLKTCFPCLISAENYKDEEIVFGKCMKFKELLAINGQGGAYEKET
ncbi:radical SAM protein [Paenibacillus lautus]|uniref:radical SAM protein n=1 Tax=Paenibacillus lautus TaxID=1401 RepID=UPI0038512DA2